MGDEGRKEEEVPASTTVERPGASSAGVSLKSLGSRYDEAQHEAYLDRLNAAVVDDKNRNIALTGRYGAGKSSVLDEFQRGQGDNARQLAISTLGPDSEGTTKTNRIQKELVKQLVYSAKPQTLRRSRFSRISSLPLWRTFIGSAAIVLVAIGLLALLGWLPSLAWTGDGHHRLVRGGVWVLVGAALAGVLTAARMALHDRFFVSDVKAAGAAVKLSPRTPTYFDEYLDEIVNYFDTEDVDIVILEDLDRFNDPHIFEALRELNTLLNSTPKRVAKKKPLRFVYAVRDSLFEQLGSDTAEEGDDAATAETVRANRTKFFDLVIPMVPFISHRNAQDLLAGLLADAGITKVNRRLVDLVARYATDMRLLLNMRNEFLVFSDRLLEQEKKAPGLDATGLFALVAYKNFHLKDFEQISRRASDLDKLYDYRRDLVRSTVARLEKEKRDLAAGRAQSQAMETSVKHLGGRLRALALVMRPESHRNWNHLWFQAGEADVTHEPSTYEFWLTAVQTPQITFFVSSSPGSARQKTGAIHGDELAALFPEVADARRWVDLNDEKTNAVTASHDRDIAFLRGADFASLATNDTFKLKVARPAAVAETAAASGTETLPAAGPAMETVELTFAQMVDDTLQSALATELVKRGHIDRNFALYAAQFYGDFTGVDVATFIVQSVQPNVMDLDYEFTSDGALKNLLDQVNEDFTYTVAAYNIEVVDHLLATGDDRAGNVVASIVAHFTANAQEFLTSYLSSGEERQRLVARLSRYGWRRVFLYLVGDEGVPADVRASLVDAALLAARPSGTYDLDDEVREFIVGQYKNMSAFTAIQDEDKIDSLVKLLAAAGVRVPELAPVDERLRAELVRRKLYELTADNLRSATGVDGAVTLDNLKGSVVYDRCLASPGPYLVAVDQDESTEYAVASAETLAAVLPAVAEPWDEDQLDALLARTAKESRLATLDDIPTEVWPLLAGHNRFRATLANVEAYRATIGSVDGNLALLLREAGTIDPTDAPDDLDRTAAAVALINASDSLPQAEDRVRLARSIEPGALPVGQISPEDGALLGLLIEAGLVADDAPSFTRFQPHGWTAYEPAIHASTNFENFMTPDLVAGMVSDLFANEQIRGRVGRRVVESFAAYVPVGDHSALKRAARYAVENTIAVPFEQIRWVAATRDRGLTMRLLQQAAPEPTPHDVVTVFAELGSPYTNFATREEAEFDVDNDEAHKAVFGRLEAANMCSVSPRRKTPRLIIKLT